MRVLVTGAGGTLGTALAPALAEAGHEPVLLDVRRLETPYECVRGDVRAADDVLRAANGVDVIVHTAAIHGIHLGKHSTRDFYDLNLTGTLNVWQAAVAVGVRWVRMFGCGQVTSTGGRSWRVRSCVSSSAAPTASRAWGFGSACSFRSRSSGTASGFCMAGSTPRTSWGR